MKNIFIITCCLLFFQSQGQNVLKYYIYLTNSQLAPKFQNINGAYQYVGNDIGLSNFFKKYQINYFERACKSCTEECFSSVLILETLSPTLVNDLFSTYPSTYRKFENLTNQKTELLSYPDDYGTTSPNPNYGAAVARKELDYINVEKAWNITTGANVTIGISDARINTTDTDYVGKVSFINPFYTQSLPYQNNIYFNHGTAVAGIAAAQGNNHYGSTGICYNCNIKGTAFGSYENLKLLGEAGVKVINMSWVSSQYNYLSGGSEYEQQIIDTLTIKHKVILVAGAGNSPSYQTNTDYYCNNGSQAGPSYTGTQYCYPASYRGVISVSAVNHFNSINLPLSTSDPSYCCTSPTMPCYIHLEDSVSPTANGSNVNNPIGVILNGYALYCNIGLPNQYASSINGLQIDYTTNPDVDILAPANKTFVFSEFAENGIITLTGAGTSMASPYVAGTAALMKSVNLCLTPNDADVILKLTTKDVEVLPLNQYFVGNIGAGVLNAGDAVVFVDEMKKVNGNALIDNHVFNRFVFKLEHINNNLKIENVSFIDNCIVDFTAKNQINLKPGTNLKPNLNGSVKLKINTSLLVCDPPSARMYSNSKSNDYQNNLLHSKVLLFPNPNSGVFDLLINNISELQNTTIKINIIDINGRTVYSESITTDNKNSFALPINVSTISNGLYFVKVSSNNYIETLKFLKK